jgi:hypothetical protein
MIAALHRKGESTRRNRVNGRIIGMLVVYLSFMHSEFAFSGQHFDRWTDPSSINESSVGTDADLPRSLSAAKRARALQNPSVTAAIQNHKLLSYIANCNKASSPRGFGCSLPITFQFQAIVEWGIVLSRYFDLTRDLVFFGDSRYRLSGSHDNRPAPIYFDANDRIYR